MFSYLIVFLVFLILAPHFSLHLFISMCFHFFVSKSDVAVIFSDFDYTDIDYIYVVTVFTVWLVRCITQKSDFVLTKFEFVEQKSDLVNEILIIESATTHHSLMSDHHRSHFLIPQSHL